MDSPQAARLHAIIKGRVQGVGFRFFTMQAAWTHEVTGWVRNRVNGDVEVMAEGKKEALDAFLIDLQHGPASASVQDVKVEWQPYQGEFTSFNPRETI
ncbi:MAG: acylphosphatase [Anaerolineaceae bacterium]|jgi:acylphosphatase|nr:MAG: acylphosphatase [Anaerolineaceae bacterium]